jgi:ssRNA-specific RNase YbeY (16S rRNA maturation enzyme)
VTFRCSYDHETDADWELMTRKEDDLIMRLPIYKPKPSSTKH